MIVANHNSQGSDRVGRDYGLVPYCYLPSLPVKAAGDIQPSRMPSKSAAIPDTLGVCARPASTRGCRPARIRSATVRLYAHEACSAKRQTPGSEGDTQCTFGAHRERSGTIPIDHPGLAR